MVRSPTTVVGTVESTQELDHNRFVVDCKKKLKPDWAGQDIVALPLVLVICNDGFDCAGTDRTRIKGITTQKIVIKRNAEIPFAISLLSIC
jgi:hypothetical protein